MMRSFPIIALVAGCVPDAPSTPSFQQHVQPILAANCVRCHGFPSIGGAPALMRLDSYDDRVVNDRDDAGQIREDFASGAATLHSLLVVRVGSSGAGQMPPRFPLDDNQIDTLERWSASCDGDKPPRGEPRPGNRAPTIAVLDTTQAGSVVQLVAEVADDDRDLVAGELRARVGLVDRFVGAVRSGEIVVRWDTAEIAPAIAPGSYPLTAHLDDGAQVHVIPLGMLVIGGS
jgi:hypothetical protein